MEAKPPPPNPRTVEEVFKDFLGRREGMLKALTTEVDKFYSQCDPEKENLCLYGYPDETYEVNLPAEEVPPELPEPALGINFARDGMQRKDWLSLVAVHSDAWLLAVAFYYGARFDRNDRKKLFNMVNELPTVFDIVTGKKQKEQKAAGHTPSGKGASKPPKNEPKPSKTKQKDEDKEEDEEEEEREEGETLCGNCGGLYSASEFWIGCDHCDKWYHGKCVKITPAKADMIKDYKCPSCAKRQRT